MPAFLTIAALRSALQVGEYAAEVMSQEALITAEAVQGDEQDGANDRGDEGEI